MQKQSKG